jgi:hypothetical protein
MRFLIAACLAAAATVSAAGAALAADEEANVPLAPSDAAGPWTLESGGQALCTVSLTKEKAGNGGFALKVPANCGDNLPPNLAGWAPTADGMSFVGSDGKVLVAFNRWSNSLFVSHRASGVDIQLQRGGPNS